jgi:hypothetical protein
MMGVVKLTAKTGRKKEKNYNPFPGMVFAAGEANLNQ